VGNEKTPWRIPLRSKLICAAVAAEFAFIYFLITPTGPWERVILVAFICASPAIQTLRVPVINRVLTYRPWTGRKDDAAWADWFVALFTGAALAICIADYVVRKIEIEFGLYISGSNPRPYVNEWNQHSLLVNLGGYGQSVSSIAAVFIAAVAIDAVVIWRFAGYKRDSLSSSIFAAIAADLAVYGLAAMLAFAPIWPWSVIW
jgi:hypothetical protein